MTSMAKKYTKRKKKQKSFLKKILLISISVILAIFAYKEYSSSKSYDDIAGLSGASLKTALHKKIRNHTILDFDVNTTARYWWDNYFTKTDWHPDGYFWDMYSDNKNKKYINGNIQNREHVMPRSWWGYSKQYASYDANGDLHNLYPADNPANSAKSNLPLGEVGITKFNNGVSKVGKNTFPNGYRGDVFEPTDAYKGDFARIFFYMVTCYEDYSNQWRSEATKSMIEKNTYPSLQPWVIEMLLKWHRQDPVSDKERNRNNEVYKIQGNRNPFIDNPELVEHIWGNRKNEPIKTEENQQNDQNGFNLTNLKEFFISLF